MKIIIAGGTGLIGKRLTERLVEAGHALTLLSLDPKRHAGLFPKSVSILHWNGRTIGPWASELNSADGIINLGGANIGEGRWTTARKKVLLDSRVNATRALVLAIEQSSKKPDVLVNASAVGYYGNVESADCREDTPPGKDFLASICVAWEKEAHAAERHGTRVVIPRTGIVLDAHGGALAKLLLPFKMFAGGPLGSGMQWFPWVHLEDEVGAIIHALTTPSLSGPFNIAAPEYFRMKDFASVLGKIMGRPSWAPVPGFMLKIILGEMAGPLLLSGQKAVSDTLQKSGYSFSYPRLEMALKHILDQPEG